MKVEFRVGGRRVAPRNLGREVSRAIEKGVQSAIEETATKAARRVRCPRHGRTGRVVRRGGKLYIEGCCEELLSQLGR